MEKKIFTALIFLILSNAANALDYQCMLGGYERRDGSNYKATSKLWADVTIGKERLIMHDEDTKKMYDLILVNKNADKESANFWFCETNSCHKHSISMSLFYEKDRLPMLILSQVDGDKKLILRRYYTCMKK
jgi:hypothetical protein